MTYIKIAWEAIKILPALYQEIKQLRMQGFSKEIRILRSEIELLTKKIKEAKTHEERRNLVSDLNSKL